MKDLYKVQNETPKESPKQQDCKCCRLGLIEHVHGRYIVLQLKGLLIVVYCPGSDNVQIKSNSLFP